MAPQTIDVHAHILSEETIRLLQSEAPKVAPKLTDIDEQFGTLDVAGNVYRHFPRGGWDLERRLADMSASKVDVQVRSEEHTSELQSLRHLVCRLLLEK